MQAQRHNIYTLIHKGIRRQLCHCMNALGALDYKDNHAVITVMEELSEVLVFCQQHLEHENTFIHPILLQLQPTLSLQSVHDHEEHEISILKLHRQVLSIRNNVGQVVASDILDLYRNFALFVAENLLHMHDEETHNANLLMRHLSDQEILAIEHRLVSSLTPQQSEQSLNLILAACTHQERSALLQELSAVFPPETLIRLVINTSLNLPATELHKLCHTSTADAKDSRIMLEGSK
ncbi:hypothetical protein P2G88_18980 [Aliiglaciecola sp. CAU 1673]|uniref:hypothetical protein n=1 Tax=Aliiglaciecola sp. CAU 1673 TaxID=3032595 RepID=UPI0023DB44F4|nr:hypothetical protein [Aliiglaciecola sp. CAU 1673]MDF2180347.1 hypothetical protein [Aliiglaciecola sp. CAU 1673]